MSSDFKRQNYHKQSQTPDSWRNPEGNHSRVRLEKKSAPNKPKAGYRTEKSERGKHPSGYEEVLVHNTGDLESIDEEKEAIMIGSKVGEKKREEIIEKAEDQGIKTLNPGEKSE